MGRRPKNKVDINKKIARKKKTKTTVKASSKFIPSMDLHEIYIIINEVQTKKIERVITVQLIDAPVLENILRDCSIIWKKRATKSQMEYSLTPPVEIEKSDEIYEFDDEFEDELKDDDQIF